MICRINKDKLGYSLPQPDSYEGYLSGVFQGYAYFNYPFERLDNSKIMGLKAIIILSSFKYLINLVDVEEVKGLNNKILQALSL
jgi:hypothetical protein